MDAITLSTAQMAESDWLETSAVWKAILIAAMANFIFKFGVAAALGPRALALRVGGVFALALAMGGAILWFWPY
jgi:uncharacterized membrane protein (DUF4010 family)